MGKSAVLERTQKPAAMRESRDIEWLVNWALEKQHAVASHPVIGSAGGGSPAWMALGTRVDGGRGSGGGGLSGKLVHDDAQIIADALGRMARRKEVAEAVALVYQHGRLGTQPDWGRCANGRYVLERRNGGEGKAIKRYADKAKARGLLGWEWKWVGHTIDTLERMMLEYVAWRAALVELRELVNPAMRQYVATGPSAAAEPWDDPVFVKMTAVPDVIVDDEVVE